jgi:NADPH:quinone reductase-like Zn-dependent oxidoreductase
MVWTEYGPPEGLRIREVPRPIPKDTELLLRIRATAVPAGDCELRALRFSIGLRILVRFLMGPIRPWDKVLGQEFAGDGEAAGARVTRVHVGDSVYGTTGFGFGAYAEYVCLPEHSPDGAWAVKPANLTYEEAATVPTGGPEALHFLRTAGPLAGRSVLIIGAGGGIGIWAVQLAKSSGAEVTGVDTTQKLEWIGRLGADRVIDYTREEDLGAAHAYDVTLDVVGRSRFSECLRAIRGGGSYLLANPSWWPRGRGPWASRTSGRSVVVRGGPPTTEELDYLRGLLESGQILCAVDRRYSLEQLREAHRYVDAGLAVGAVAISVSAPPSSAQTAPPGRYG